MSASLCALLALFAAPVEMPKVLDDRLQLELILQEPDLVTPAGLTIDRQGRVLVIESHTHFRPQGYQGPPHDRILLVDPQKKPAKPTVFFEGTKYTMSVAQGPDDWIYVATRSEIFRIKDTDGDDKADAREEIAHLETKGNYPHNGLSGFAFHEDEVYFGFGENLGADYNLISHTGEKLSGGGEGGNIYACRPDGAKLRRVATGFWNPFHVTFDGSGNLFTVDNDPDSRPPCRLLHVVEGGDYGFKFRNGRKGIHPFTAWNGELPGTLPMVAGTGEAPCAVVAYLSPYGKSQLPQEYRDALLVTSWGDHRIESYALTRRGASFSGSMKPLVVGGENFRPVGMAVAPDGSLYFSDWVDRSYPLHGKGRLWRLSAKPNSEGRVDLPRFAFATAKPTSDAEQRDALRRVWKEMTDKKSVDPFAWQSVASRLMDLLRREPKWDAQARSDYFNRYAALNSPESMIWATIAAREANAESPLSLTPSLLKHADPRVKLLGVMWAGEERMTALRPDVERVLTEPGLTRELFEACLAALELIDGETPAGSILSDPKKETAGEQYVFQMLRSGSTLPGVRRFALKALRPDHPQLDMQLLARLAADSDAATRIEAIRSIRERPPAERAEVLREMARSDRPTAERLEAIAGLVPEDAGDRATLEELAQSNEGALKAAAARLLPPAKFHAELTTLGQLAGAGDPAAGERLFFHPRVAACYKCHEHEGRGASIGPALTTLGRGASRERILQSLLEPSREIAPQYVPWKITTVDGLEYTGVYVGEEVDGTHRYADVHGKILRIHPRQFEHREATKQSIMPSDFGKLLSPEELRDLAAFLSGK